MDPTETGVADIGLFRLAERRLAWVARRQELLAQNVANANTPGLPAARPDAVRPFVVRKRSLPPRWRGPIPCT